MSLDKLIEERAGSGIGRGPITAILLWRSIKKYLTVPNWQKLKLSCGMEIMLPRGSMGAAGGEKDNGKFVSLHGDVSAGNGSGRVLSVANR